MGRNDGGPTKGSRFTLRAPLERSTSTLAADVLEGLRSVPKRIPPKHFYDARGSKLFELICQTEEYYPTRTEQRLLEALAPDLMSRLRPTHLVELGSGSAQKTCALFDAAAATGLSCRYVPFDVSESALRGSTELLLRKYDWLHVEGVVGDYERHLSQIPAGRRRLFVFLGGTIGNFEPAAAVAFLRRVRDVMSPDDQFLLGTDLVKETAVLDRAYNDSGGLTEAFNKNVLLVVNRELGGRFDPDTFHHVAFFDARRSQIEMHLESRVDQRVPIAALDWTVEFRSGERVLTEISRKFTRRSVTELLSDAGLELLSWHEPPDGAFGLSLSAVGSGPPPPAPKPRRGGSP